MSTSQRAASFAALLTIGVVLLVGLLPADARSSGDRRGADRIAPRKVITRRVAPGLVFTKIVEKKVPRRTFVLAMAPSKQVTLDVTLTEDALPARRTLSKVAQIHGALAAVNGDYSGNGDPFHPLAVDGELVQTSSQLGTLFAITANERRTFFGKPAVSIVVSDLASPASYAIARWNDGPPALGEIVGFSPLGGTLEPPPAFSCSVRLLPTGPPTHASGDGVDRDYVTDETGCLIEPMARNEGVVLSATAGTDEATKLLALSVGTAVRLHWTLGWPAVFDAVGGAPLLVENGSLVGRCRSGCGSQPRTGIGVTSAGTILLVVVDGRQPRWSVGPTMAEFARIMRSLGAVWALNLDGGGSSEMVVEGVVVNRPSDGRERRISNAILVLPGPDPDEQ